MYITLFVRALANNAHVQDVQNHMANELETQWEQRKEETNKYRAWQSCRFRIITGHERKKGNGKSTAIYPIVSLSCASPAQNER